MRLFFSVVFQLCDFPLVYFSGLFSLVISWFGVHFVHSFH